MLPYFKFIFCFQRYLLNCVSSRFWKSIFQQPRAEARWRIAWRVKAIQKRISENKEKVIYWPQYAEDFYHPVEEKSNLIPQDGILNITFTGNIGTAQGLAILPETAKLLAERSIRVRFNIVGDGRNKENLGFSGRVVR